MHLLITLPRGNRLCGLLAETEIVGGKSFSLDKSSTKGKVRETKFLALIFFDHRGNNPNRKRRSSNFPYFSLLFLVKKSRNEAPRASSETRCIRGKRFHPPLCFHLSLPPSPFLPSFFRDVQPQPQLSHRNPCTFN